MRIASSRALIQRCAKGRVAVARAEPFLHLKNSEVYVHRSEVQAVYFWKMNVKEGYLILIESSNYVEMFLISVTRKMIFQQLR